MRHDHGEVHGVLVDDALLDIEDLRSQTWNGAREVREVLESVGDTRGG